MALALGKTHSEILDLPADEIQRWRAYYSLQPFGFYRDEYFNARTLSTIMAASGNYKEIPDTNELMGFTTAMTDFSKPGKRIANKIRAVLGQFKNGS